MNTDKLQTGNFPNSLQLPHFPTRWQAVVWRLWGLVPFRRLAQVLEMSENDLIREGGRLGLTPPDRVDPAWLEKSYLSIIRSVWHLLTYGQILEILDWTQDRLLKVFEEEDFFWSKLGRLKPETGDKVLYQPLGEKEKAATDWIRNVLDQYFPPDERQRKEAVFSFADDYRKKRFVRVDKTLCDFSFKIIHSYAAGCGDVFLDIEQHDPVPDGLLQAYSELGITGIWTHAVLRDFFPLNGAEEFSLYWERRLENLNKVAAKCRQYGLELFLYFNEPRSMPMQFYEKFPHWGGWKLPDDKGMTMCTTRTNEVLKYLEDGMYFLFSRVPALGGIFSIAMSENPTHCFYSNHKELCPYCREVPGEKIIADVLCAMERGMHKAAPQAKMIVYDWAWRPIKQSTDNVPFKCAVLDRLPRNVIAASVSEWGKILHIGGVNVYLKDYSISQPGPGPESQEFWKHADQLGMATAAKIQMNNTWEIAAVPYIPVPYLVQEHLQNLKKEGISGLILSWTLGGYPGGNLALLNASPEQIAQSLFSPRLAKSVCQAWELFSDSFRQFPFHNASVLYRSPVNYGPKNLLRLKKTGYAATMLGFPYDDLESWRGPYPEDVFLKQFSLLTDGWKKGLEILKQEPVPKTEDEKKAFDEVCRIAETVFIHLRSTCLQIHFIIAREHGFRKDEMRKCAEEEIVLAKRLHELVRCDSRIGFEASNHYFYSLNDLKEKIISCVDILRELGTDSPRGGAKTLFLKTK